jgi:hypothetical protein
MTRLEALALSAFGLTWGGGVTYSSLAERVTGFANSITLSEALAVSALGSTWNGFVSSLGASIFLGWASLAVCSDAEINVYLN